MDVLAALVPLLQTVVWVGLIVGVLIWGRRYWSGILGAVRARIEGGDTVKVGIAGFNAELQRETVGMVRLDPGDESAGVEDEAPGSLEGPRTAIGKAQRGVHVVHVAVPTDGQDYDIFVYLSGWRRSAYGLPDDLSDVGSAEFYLGPKFTPSSALVTYADGQRLGFVTSAYGPVICMCKVTFTDGYQVTMSRYLDFESATFTERSLSRI